MVNGVSETPDSCSGPRVVGTRTKGRRRGSGVEDAQVRHVRGTEGRLLDNPHTVRRTMGPPSTRWTDVNQPVNRERVQKINESQQYVVNKRGANFYRRTFLFEVLHSLTRSDDGEMSSYVNVVRVFSRRSELTPYFTSFHNKR